MSNMNLYRGFTSSSSEPINYSRGGFSSITWSFVIIFITLSLFGGAKAYKSQFLEKKIETLDKSIAQESESLSLESLGQVIGFNQRLKEVKNRLIVLDAPEQSPAAIFALVQKSIIPGVLVESIEYDANAKTLSVSYFCDNFNQVAAQVMSFKKSEGISNVRLEEKKGTTSDKKSGVTFVLKGDKK